jgi:hypothetical protein
LLIPCLGRHKLRFGAHEQLVNVFQRVDHKLGRVLQIVNHHVGEDLGALVLALKLFDLPLLPIDNVVGVVGLHHSHFEAVSLLPNVGHLFF